MIYKIVIILVFYFLAACNNPVKVPGENQKYFETNKYFLNEAAMLQLKNAAIVKTFIKNDSTETIRSEKVDWKTELLPFLQINLHKPALVNSFSIDTITEANKTLIQYVAKDSTLELRDLKIYLSEAKVDSLFGVMKSSNLYYNAVDTIAYFGNGNYRISVWNKPRIGKEVRFVLVGSSNLGNTD